jgi:hypothetical protein
MIAIQPTVIPHNRRHPCATLSRPALHDSIKPVEPGSQGKPLWTHPLRFKSHFDHPIFAVGDLDGDGRPEVIVKDVSPAGDPAAFEVAALEGRDGSTRWTWRGGSRSDRQDRLRDPLFLVDSHGNGRAEVYLSASREVRLSGGPVDAQRLAQLRRDLDPNATLLSYPGPHAPDPRYPLGTGLVPE